MGGLLAESEGSVRRPRPTRWRTQKVSYVLVVGDRKMEAGRVAVRLRTEEDLGLMSVTDLIARVQGVVEAKKGL